ncbi:MAG TPA: metallophosphoesterase, partial [Rubrobacter sp.]|nr:metallophosphoesterase [Rubrobacter sp.]
YHAGTMVQKGSRVTAIYDIHGNLPALEAVLAELESVTPDLIVVGGDVVAGPMPTEVMDRLVTLGEPMPIGRSLQPMMTDRTLTLSTWQTPRSALLRTLPPRSTANTETF